VRAPAHDTQPQVLVKVPAEILPRLRHPRADVVQLSSLTSM
jgi:hypothetical protein